MDNQTSSHKNDLELGDSKRTDKPIRFIPMDHIYWEDWGRMRLVFCKGETYSGILHSSGKITAESPAFGVSDYVNRSEIKILDL